MDRWCRRTNANRLLLCPWKDRGVRSHILLSWIIDIWHPICVYLSHIFHTVKLNKASLSTQEKKSYSRYPFLFYEKKNAAVGYEIEDNNCQHWQDLERICQTKSARFSTSGWVGIYSHREKAAWAKPTVDSTLQHSRSWARDPSADFGTKESTEEDQGLLYARIADGEDAIHSSGTGFSRWGCLVEKQGKTFMSELRNSASTLSPSSPLQQRYFHPPPHCHSPDH